MLRKSHNGECTNEDINKELDDEIKIFKRGNRRRNPRNDDTSTRGIPTPDNPKNKRNPRSHDGGSKLDRRSSSGIGRNRR